jgi:hypothetical protein
MKFPIAFCAVLLIGCKDEPPDPNLFQPVDDTLNITQLSTGIASAPADFDVSDYIKLRGSWESFSSFVGEVSPYADPLGKVYYAISPLGQFTTKTIKLDFSRITGRNIANSGREAADSRGYKTVLAAIRLPADIERIGDRAFNGCANLTRIVFLGRAPPLLGSYALSGISVDKELIIVVPPGTEGAYQSFKTAREAEGALVTLISGGE